MKIVRIIFSLLFILASVLTGLIANVVRTDPKLVNFKISNFSFRGQALPFVKDLDITLLTSLIGAAVFLLLIAVIIWPKSSKRTKKARGPAATSAVLDAIPASSGSSHELPPIAAATLKEEMDGPSPPVPEAEDPAPQEDLDEQTLRMLINKEQQTIDRQIATEIINKSYPQIAPVVPLFYDEESLVALARQIIAILRIRVKLKDKSMSSYQFSQFEDKAYKMEEEKTFYKFMPKNPAALSKELQALAGKIFAQNSYREVQQKAMASRDDWQILSVKELS